MLRHRLLIALDSVGIDPLGHNRPDSVYSASRFLFPAAHAGETLPIDEAPFPGVLVETDVTGGAERGAIECALTYTSIFSGQSAISRHGMMDGLGLKEKLLEEMVREQNLFEHFENACLANALFPVHLPFLGGSYLQHELRHFTREQVESSLRFDGKPMTLRGGHKPGFAELFTLAEINQNIFVYAAREAGVRLRTWEDVRRNEALTSSMTHELEARFSVESFDESPLPLRTPEEAAAILAGLTRQHEFTFYKYQIPDLVSHTGRVELAREVFATIERFVFAVLELLDPDETQVIVTSDHGHLEQVAYAHGHPKSKVPTWCFGPDAVQFADRLRTPEGIFSVLTEPAGAMT